MYKGINQYHVVMEVDPKFQQDPQALNNIYVPSSTGQPGSSQRLYASRSRHYLAARSIIRAVFPP